MPMCAYTTINLVDHR